MTEIAIIGSDIQEVLGSATALNILFNLPLWAGAILTILDSFLFLFIHYFGVKKLELFFAFLILVMSVCFCANMFTSKADVNEIAYGTLVPLIPKGSLESMLGLVGAVIMPHNLYLHSSLVLTRKINTNNRNHVNEANIYNTIESSFSLFISFVINIAVISTFGAYVINNGHAGDLNYDLDLLSASHALDGAFGSAAKYVWAIGLLAAG